MLERATELVDDRVPLAGQDGGAQQLLHHLGVGLHTGDVCVVPGPRFEAVDVQRPDGAHAEPQRSAEDRSHAERADLLPEERPSVVGDEVGGEDERVVDERVDARPLPRLLLRRFEGRGPAVRGTDVVQRLLVVDQHHAGPVGSEDRRARLDDSVERRPELALAEVVGPQVGHRPRNRARIHAPRLAHWAPLLLPAAGRSAGAGQTGERRES